MDHFLATKTFFNQTVKPSISFSTRRRIDILLDYVPNKSVLDLGCIEHDLSVHEKNDWWLHGLIKTKARHTVGVDYENESAQRLNNAGYNIIVADVENMDLKERFDIVMAGELFEHLTNHRSFLDSVKRHLGDDGLFIASMPNANSLNYFLQNCIFGHEVDAWDHAAFFTPITLSVMLKKCGFTPLKIILYQPAEIFHHTQLSRKIIAAISNRIQQLACWFKPSLARGLIVIAKPTSSA